MSRKSDSGQGAPREHRGLAKISSSIIRRGLDDLSRAEAKKGRVLLVGHNAALAEAERALREDGYEVRSASLEQNLVALAEDFDPHVVVLGTAPTEELIAALKDGCRGKLVFWGGPDGCGDLQRRLESFDLGFLPAAATRERLLRDVRAWTVDAWNRRGLRLAARGDLLDAIRLHERALAIDPRCSAAWRFKGDCLNELGRGADAIACYDAAIEHGPDFPILPWIGKGEALGRAGRFDDATACFERAIALSSTVPSAIRALMDFGTALHHWGRYDEAIRCFDRALGMELPPGYLDELNRGMVYADAWNAKGNTYYRMGRHPESIECYRRSMALHPVDWTAAGDRAGSSNKGFIGRFDEAIRNYREATTGAGRE